MTLKSLLQALKSSKSIIIKLYDEAELLLIIFEHPGFDHLDDDLLEREVNSFEINNLNTLSIILKDPLNEDPETNDNP